MKILFVNDEDNNDYAFELNPKTITGLLMELLKKKLLTIEKVSEFIQLVVQEKYEDVIYSDEISDITMSDRFHVLEIKDEWEEDCVWIND